MGIDNLYTPRQQEVLHQYYTTDFFIMINSGSVRAGKTTIDNDIFLQELKNVKKRAKAAGVSNPQYICAGASIGTFYRNVVMEINSKYDLELKLDKFNSFNLYGVQVTVFGHEKINDLNKITGMTAWGAYINEGTKANKAVFDEILKRCSGKNSRVICDTNPDHPNHFLKKDYIDKADGERILYNVFLIDQNTFLDPNYIANTKATTPSGVFYKRKILAQWCMAEGAIYEDFDDEIHYINYEEFLDKDIENIYFGVDWGYTEGHAGCITVIGKERLTDEEQKHNLTCKESEKVKNKIYLIEEHAKEKKGIAYWVNRALELEEKYKNVLRKLNINRLQRVLDRELTDREVEDAERDITELTWYCDHEDQEKMDEFRNAGLYVRNANKSVLNGIEHICTLLKTNRMFVVRENVDLFKNEIYTYIWGKDEKPKKENDNVLDSLRYGIYSEYKDGGFWFG